MKSKQIMAALLAGGLTLAANLRAADPPEPAPSLSARPTQSEAGDRELLLQVNQIIAMYAGPATGSDVQAMVQKGVVTLAGRIASVLQKLVLESQIKGLSGVVGLIDDQLVPSNAWLGQGHSVRELRRPPQPQA